MFQKDYSRRFGPGYLPSNAAAAGLGQGLLCKTRYDFAVDGGAVSTITPKQNGIIPIYAIITECLIYVITTTVGSTGNISIGLSAGGAGVAALLAATARASLSAGSFFQGIPVQSATGANTSLIHMSAAGSPTVTISTNALTAGVIEIFTRFVLASA